MDNVQKIEDSLWEAAEKLRVDSGLKSTQYSTPLLGLVFLRFASIKYDRFKEEIEAEYNRFKGGRNEKRIEDIALQKCGYYLPPQSHFDYLLSLSESEDIPLTIKKAMEGIEEFKPELVGSLPKEEYLNLEPSTEDDETAAVRDYSLPASLLKIINRIPKDVAGDVFGKVYEYFLGKFASNEGKGGGEYYTPPSVVRLMVEMIPYKGKILDPACGSGGMFVQSADFVARSNAKPDEIRVYGVERESETVKLSRMNMFIHGLSSEIVQANSYYADPHNCYGDFDYILANPPFNVKDVNYDKVKDDRRFNTFGVPKNKTKAGKKKDSETVPNANYLWINLFATSLNATGRAALVMANGASDAGKSEAEIRSRLVENGIVSCMLSLPSNMFYTVTLPATLWFFDKARCEDKRVLFINACNVYRQIDRTHREFTAEQIANLACIRHLYQGDSTYYNSHVEQYSKKIEELNVALDEALKAKKAVSKEVLKFQEENPDKNLTNVLKKKVEDAAQQVADIEVEIDYFIQQRDWLTDNFPGGVYRDVIGLCKAASIEEIREQDYSLNPGRYVGVSLDVEDRNDFTAAMGELKQTLTSLNDKSQELMNSIMDNLKELGV